MGIDFNINDLKIEVGPFAKTFQQTNQERAAVAAALDSSRSELTFLQPQVGWRERLFGGSLGGDSSVAKRFKELRASIETMKIRLNLLEENLKNDNEVVSKLVSNFLTKKSVTFQRLLGQTKYFQDLYSASVTYNSLLQDAHNKVSDALMLTSWDTLINHPQARAGIHAFKTATTKYQREIDTINEAVGVDLHNGRRLEDYIQFSSESVALENFNKIQSQVKSNLKNAELRFKENRKATLDMIERCLNLIR